MAVQAGEGGFRLAETTRIGVAGETKALAGVAAFLRDKVRTAAGLELASQAGGSAASADGAIRLATVGDRQDLGEEGYELVVSPEGVTIQANTTTGVFWGAQTLLQMIASNLAGKDPDRSDKHVSLASVRIVDRPRFGWRGLMLDCSRTFLTVDFLKKYVDVLSFYKMNVLQLHLTDDQGWRLEIRKHPRLTEVGSKFDECFTGEIDGYYTQEQIRDLVAYAAARQVTIVPEIEIPGHCLSLLKSYPELSCREGQDQYVIAPYMFMSDPHPKKVPATPYGVVCVGNEKTFQILEDVLTEVIELFPSEYIHIAGDECPKSFWKACPKCQARIKAEGLGDEDELQSYFVKRVAKMIRDRGRKAIGWDEILEGGLAPQVAMMSWRSLEAGITAAKLGHPAVMASKSHLYFDYCYNRTPASLVYAFEPIPPELSPEQQSLVLGAQACMWTHLARTETGIDMSIFPRLLALAEVAWTPAERRQWEDFDARMRFHEPILKSKKVACFVRNDGIVAPNLTTGQDGRLWLVNSANQIHLREGDSWKRFPGEARQLTSGPDGTIWSVSTKPAEGGYVLMRWSGSAWGPIGPNIAAVQISAAPDGSLWTASDTYAINRLADGKFTNLRGLARQVSVGPDGNAAILTMDPSNGGYELFSAPPGARWRRVVPVMAGVHVVAGPAGQLWLLRDDGTLCHRSGDIWHDCPGKVAQFAIAADGTVWAIDRKASGGESRLLQWTGHDWRNVDRLP